MLVVKKSRGKFVAFGIFSVLLVFFINTGFQAYAQIKEQKKHEIVEEDSFQRPEPSRPIQPEIPTTNRYQEDKVFLEYADSLYKLKSNKKDTIERQILKGNVKFRQAGLWMFCDSAYYYPEENSLDAFSNVKMEQGDTLFVYADQLYYDGDLHLAKLKNGPTRNKVTLINKDVTLTTDSLDYDMAIDLGWYQKWGTIDDKVNTLTSLYGEYSPKTKRAEFFTDVVLVNHKDGFTLLTDTLYYSTETHIANIESKTEIQSENDTIFTTQATYYTDSGNADLLSRSLIIHRDSTGNITTLEGDSIIYDNATRISRAYMFRDPFKRSNPMVITDTAQKTTLIGGFGIYNDSTKEALATIYPLLMEYSQGDTLFLRADTIKTYIVTEMIASHKRRTKSGYPEWEGEIIVMKDSIDGSMWIDSSFFKVEIPFAKAPQQMLFKVAPPPKEPELLIVSEIEEIEETLVEEKIEEVILEEDQPEIIETDIVWPKQLVADVELLPVDSIYVFPDYSQEPDFNSSIYDEIKTEPGDSIPYEFHVILAYHRARIFKQDMQGVADSIVFVEKDSMLYMFRKPILWSGERQVTGNRIDVHFNDSTTDWAYLPEYGLMSEHVEEDFYNQIYGKEITTYFANQTLRRMSVSGNVETIFLPQESDSTYNRLVNAESSYMEVYLDSNKLDWMKMWPEVSGTVTPIFLVKRNQMYLQKFKWWGFLRPEREWYGDKVKWADNLGEVPEELEQYFLSPSDFGEPKTFTGTRVTLPPSSLPIWEDFDKVELSDTLDILLAPDSLNTLPPLAPDSVSMELSGDTINLSPNELEDIDSESIQDVEEIEDIETDEATQTELQSEKIEEALKEEKETAIKEEEEESNE